MQKRCLLISGKKKKKEQERTNTTVLYARYPNRTSDLRITSATPYHLAKRADLTMTKPQPKSYIILMTISKTRSVNAWMYAKYTVPIQDLIVRDVGLRQTRAESKWGSENNIIGRMLACIVACFTNHNTLRHKWIFMNLPFSEICVRLL
jgi:hypothetical protein